MHLCPAPCAAAAIAARAKHFLTSRCYSCVMTALLPCGTPAAVVPLKLELPARAAAAVLRRFHCQHSGGTAEVEWVVYNDALAVLCALQPEAPQLAWARKSIEAERWQATEVELQQLRRVRR